MFKRLGVGEGLDVVDGFSVDDGAHREFGELSGSAELAERLASKSMTCITAR